MVVYTGDSQVGGFVKALHCGGNDGANVSSPEGWMGSGTREVGESMDSIVDVVMHPALVKTYVCLVIIHYRSDE